MFSYTMTEQGKSKRKMKRGPGKQAIVSFRLEGPLGKELDASIAAVPIRSVVSRGHMCRKIVMDFLMGRLVYTIPDYRAVDPVRSRQEDHQQRAES